MDSNRRVTLIMTSIAVIGFCGSLIFVLSNFVLANSQSVIINELAWAGSSSSSSDEWIELKNTTNEDINLTGWKLTKLVKTQDSLEEKLMLEILENIDNPEVNIINQNDYFLISNNTHDHFFGDKESVLNIEPDYITSTVSLSNSTLHIRLYNSSEELIDEAGDGSSPLAGNNTDKTSMERKNPWGNGSLEENWYSATSATNLDIDAFDLGTPKNDNSIPPLLPPEITTITPNENQIGIVWEAEQITGDNFSLDGITQIKLEKDNNTIWASTLNVVSPFTILNISFDLTTAEVGDWDLIIINPDGQTDTLFDAVTLWEEEEEPEIVWDLSDNIEITELYPSPASGEEEFIELYNSGNNSVNLNGWKLDDKSPGGSSVYLINTDLIISPHQYLVFSKSQTKIALNNSGDYSQLIKPNDVILEITPDYGNAKAGLSYIKIDDTWSWTENITKGYENELTEEKEENEDQNTTNKPFVFGVESDIKDPWKVIINLEGGKTTDGVNLFWDINLPGALGSLEIFMSEDKDEQGTKMANLSPRKNNYEITDLEPNTEYYFQIISSYNADDIESNRIKIKTSKTISTVKESTTGFLRQILITELLPKPESGESEYIELFNPTDEPVNITGWRLEDASGKSYILNSLDLTIQSENENNLIIEPGEYLLLHYEITKIRLNNTGGDEVIILDGEENIIDEVTYTESAKTGLAYVLAPNNKWFWTDEITPGMENDISFAGILGDSSNYLVDSGLKTNILIYCLLGLLFGIIGYQSFKYARRI